MRILFITPLYPGYYNQSSIEATHVVHHIARELIKNHDVQVIRIWPYYPKILNLWKKSEAINKHSYIEEFTLDQVNILRVPIMKLPKFPYFSNHLDGAVKIIKEKIYREEGPDIIICDTLDPSIYIGNAIAKKHNSILVASLHNTDIKYLSKKRNYKKFNRIEQNINKIVFRSPVVEGNFLNLYSGNRKKEDFFKIGFGLDKPVFLSKNKLEMKVMNAKKEIIVAANLKKLKKVDILVKSFAAMANNSNYILRIIGDGVERKTLEDLSNSLDCKEQIIFEGEKTREEVLQFMENAEIFAMVSSPETFGLVYLEAMAKGCITIGSRKEGIDGIIHHNVNGFLSKPNDVQDLKNILDKITSLSLNEKRKIIYCASKTACNFDNENLSKLYMAKILNRNL